MKELKREIRLFIAVKFLGWCYHTMPDCDFKRKLGVLISESGLSGIN